MVVDLVASDPRVGDAFVWYLHFALIVREGPLMVALAVASGPECFFKTTSKRLAMIVHSIDIRLRIHVWVTIWRFAVI